MSDFLYPFLSGEQTDRASLLADLTTSAREKLTASDALRSQTLTDLDATLDATAQSMVEHFTTGGRLFVFGNGGSSTDAASVASLFGRPPAGEPLPARALVDDAAVLTALGNDIGFESVFSRQLIALGRPVDMALAISTSGNSANLVRAFREARRIGMLTIGMAGYGGGSMAACDDVDHLLVVESDSVHRIQEAQAAVAYSLWRRVIRALEQQ